MNKNSGTVKKYISLIKFEHTLFAMPFAIIGFFLALYRTNAEFQWELLLYVLLCMIFARNAAMAFNRYIDRVPDKENPRTSGRELPRGLLNPDAVLMFVIINCILFIGTAFFINTMVFYLSPLALAIVLGYNVVKKHTIFGHFVLGLGLSLAPIGAYLSVTGAFGLLPVLFSVIVIFWVSGFDIIYSLQDEQFDKSHAIRSIPARIGQKNALIVSVALHFICVLLVLYTGYYAGFGVLYWIGALIFSALLFYQHIIIKPNYFKKISIAFFVSNSLASSIFAIFTVLDLLPLFF